MIATGIILVILAVVGIVLWRRKKASNEAVAVVLTPLPLGNREQVSVFQGFGGAIVAGEDDETTTARHNLYINLVEGWGQYWTGRAGMLTHFSLAGTLDWSFVPVGLEKSRRLLGLNQKIKLFAQIPCCQAAPGYTDLPDNHAWWLRDAAGNRVLAWPAGTEGEVSYKLDLSRADLRLHIANMALRVLQTGIFDGIFFDTWLDDADHQDLIRLTRQTIGEGKLIFCNCNYRICPLTAPYMDGAWIESGPVSTAPEWALVQKALDYNERHCRQPARNLLEISGDRRDLAKMRATTCLGLTRGNCDVLFSDPNYLPGIDHQHDWYPFWETKLGKPTGQPLAAGMIGTRREFERGTAVFNPPGGNQIELTFSEQRTDVASGIRRTVHVLAPGDGGIYLL